MNERIRRIGATALLAGVIALTAVAIWQTRNSAAGDRMTVSRQPQGVMGTTCRIVAVVSASKPDRAQFPLDVAEQQLRHVESLCSTYIESSELSRFNRGDTHSVSYETELILVAAYRAWAETDGAFDVTARPLYQLWKRCGKEGRLPTPDEIAEARKQSSWENVPVEYPRGIQLILKDARVEFDLGGIAKGTAIDMALGAMKSEQAVGGLVDVGGDVGCFGISPDGKGWPIGLRDPFGGDVLFTLRLPGGAVCTSGNYARFVEIDGKRYSHIVDPRTGMPADHVPSVTVIAGDAETADVWATALSVLGADGLTKLPAGVEAMVVTGTADDYDVATTPGFNAYIKPEARNPKPE